MLRYSTCAKTSEEASATLPILKWRRLTQVEAIKALLGRPGVDVEARDKQGQTPLMLAVRAQQQPAALALTAAGASLDVSNVSQSHRHHRLASVSVSTRS
jgi:ankyrin repeat protein